MIDWSSYVCSSDLGLVFAAGWAPEAALFGQRDLVPSRSSTPCSPCLGTGYVGAAGPRTARSRGSAPRCQARRVASRLGIAPTATCRQSRHPQDPSGDGGLSVLALTAAWRVRSRPKSSAVRRTLRG